MLPKDQILNQGRYRILNGIGQDETEAIYECFDESAKVKVLIKEILFTTKKVISAPELDQLREHFISKARKLLELNHDSLLKVSDYFSEIDRFYLVTEFSEGNNLNKLLEKAKCSFALSNVLNWADQLLFVLNYLHTQAKPLFHNGIKPQNLRLTVEGKLKIFPMCIAANSDANGNPTSPQTTDSAFINYLPLERIWDRLDPASQSVITKTYDEKSEKILQMPADARSDVYSLGATLYHLATGQAPIDALTRSIELLEGKNDPLIPLNELNPSIPHEVSDVFMKALEIKREERFDSAVIMRQVLRTSLLRAKERQANEAKKAVAAPKEFVGETKPLPQEKAAVQENIKPLETVNEVSEPLEAQETQTVPVENSVCENPPMQTVSL
ncbi:MAG TPA: serine/threonine-protein kinase, partial [Pyrinomonadaceae bacterium]|nr:serine/threonine-protein kinase [Pyrinomonadaceae bacterium]